MLFRPVAAACAAALVALTGCSLTQSNASPRSGSGPVSVTSSAHACRLSSTRVKSGPAVFKIRNTGSAVTEFYVYARDGRSIVAEVENVGPGLSRDLVVSLAPGRYVTACKPGMAGTGIRGTLTATGTASSAVAGLSGSAIRQATGRYAAYVRAEADRLLPATTAFVAAYKAGDDARARKLYPRARTPWERIEPVAESFGDLDPKTDLRQADLEPGQRWTGWHRIEKDLWPPAKGYHALSPAQRATYGDDLLANVTTLHRRVQQLTYTVDQIGNGSKGLLDEVATGKITGEEDVWSHTDLWDFQANVDGARAGFTHLEPLLQVKDPALARAIAAQFAALDRLLATYRQGGGFVSYDRVTEAQRKRLSDAVNALAEPLSKMTGAITL
jgi:iron uptake system component EfeO